MRKLNNIDAARSIGRTYGPLGKNDKNFTAFVDAVDLAIAARNIKRDAEFRAAAREAFEASLFAATHNPR